MLRVRLLAVLARVPLLVADVPVVPRVPDWHRYLAERARKNVRRGQLHAAMHTIIMIFRSRPLPKPS